MGLAEWNKKEELVAEQALKHLRQYTTLLQAFTTVDRAELALILKVQEFCYENMNFMKAFQKIILLFYKGNIHSIFDLNFFFFHFGIDHNIDRNELLFPNQNRFDANIMLTFYDLEVFTFCHWIFLLNQLRYNWHISLHLIDRISILEK